MSVRATKRISAVLAAFMAGAWLGWPLPARSVATDSNTAQWAGGSIGRGEPELSSTHAAPVAINVHAKVGQGLLLTGALVLALGGLARLLLRRNRPNARPVTSTTIPRACP